MHNIILANTILAPSEYTNERKPNAIVSQSESSRRNHLSTEHLLFKCTTSRWGRTTSGTANYSFLHLPLRLATLLAVIKDVNLVKHIAYIGTSPWDWMNNHGIIISTLFRRHV